MQIPDDMKNQIPTEPQWSPEFYGPGYYGKGERNGFMSYDFDSEEQQRQLALKWQFCTEVPHRSAFFVGCALGFEVAYWQRKGRHATGVDVSKWAIENAHPMARFFVALYDGRAFPWLADNAVDLVASFDVLTHVPDHMIEGLCDDIVRIARRGIVFRSIVKNFRNLEDKVDFLDGSWGRYRRLEEWDRLFCRSGKFRLHWLKMHEQYEATAIFRRVEEGKP